MRNFLKETARWCNRLLLCVPVLLMLFALILSSLVIVLLSPLIAFFGANGCKLEYTRSESWWEIYKRNLIMLCTDELPIVRWYKG